MPSGPRRCKTSEADVKLRGRDEPASAFMHHRWTPASRRLTGSRLRTPGLFVAVEVELLDDPRLPAFLLHDGNAQVPRVDRGGQVQSGVRFADDLRRDHRPVLAVVGRLDAVRGRPPHVLEVLTLLAAGIDIDADDFAASG